MVTKEQFEAVYRQFPPLKCESFYLKNFTISSLYLRPITALLLFIGLIGPCIFAVLAHVFKWSLICIHIPTFIYAGLLALIGITSLLIWFKRYIRIRRICKILNITKKQYKEIVNKYYYENYYPDIKDYISNCLLKDK